MKCILFVLIFGWVSLPPVEAATIHALIIGDTLDEGDVTRAAIRADMGYMQTLVYKIAQHTDMATNVVLLTGLKFSPERLLEAIKKINAQEEDTILFYYNSHGYRTQDKLSPWPNFYFPNEYAGVSYDHVVELLSQKNSRFLLVIADTCNSLIETPRLPRMVRALGFAPNEEKTKQNYKRLFLEYQGKILIASAEQGHFAYAEKDGGIFSKAFLAKLHTETERADVADWGHIILNTTNSIANYQTPIYCIE